MAIGAILSLIFKPESVHVRRWAYLSISFTLLVFVSYIPVYVIAFILSLIPVLGMLLRDVLMGLYGLGVILVYLMGLLRAVEGKSWRPPLISQISDALMRF